MKNELHTYEGIELGKRGYQQKLAELSKRYCKICDKVLDIDSFYHNNKDPSGRTSGCKSCKSHRTRTLYSKPKKDYMKNNKLRSRYNIGLGQYTQLVESCEGKCWCCSTKTDVLHVDHQHDTEDLRGLLCRKCNTGIGLLGDNIEGIKNALMYLERYEQYGCIRDLNFEEGSIERSDAGSSKS